MKFIDVRDSWLTPAVLVATALLCAPAQASLTSIGNGLIYDDVSDVTWMADGYAFSLDIAGSSANPATNPYTGPLLGSVVTPPVGSAHTIDANDLSYQSGLGRWLGSWWAASAWADSFSYQYGSRTVAEWRLPTSAEAQHLIDAIGAGQYAATGPFTWVPPFFWTADVTSATHADVARPLFGTIDNFSLMNGSLPRYSNIWAVAPGNVSSVPLPAAVWLFGSALAGLGICGRRRVEAQD
ncbi:VPLPA-CTERM sorting domain-containing protein [Methylomonas sp. DH-1]|uniref:VPLPA-CTERM sorting domain-containing protein n=1 Tax=Methylomonas sp. (strain DH-1) TaxID=1727196 RepID=UPI0007C8D263|nr:VPLPA-CTERM sorting domain-containing protein [Methylomonas sp. DH-1]ANE57304.1 hypothetical protein AYM39_20385 [Methylomonas sp. DH-1]